MPVTQRMRLPFHPSIEWNASVSRLLTNLSDVPKHEVRHQLMAADYVLPCVPSVSESLRQDFFQSVPREQRIQTVVACQHSDDSLQRTLEECKFEKEDRILIVGGNDKQLKIEQDASFLTSQKAIQIAAPLCTVWAVANPNNPTEASILSKLEAGATGIITQPLLSSRAAYAFEQYPVDDNISYVLGLALPKTLKDLCFWLKLTDLQQVADDDFMVKEHLSWFQNKHESKEWIERQLQIIENIDNVSGVHCMPMGNVPDLLAVLEPDDEEESQDDKRTLSTKRKGLR